MRGKELGAGFAAGAVLATVVATGVLQAQPAAEAPATVVSTPIVGVRSVAHTPGSVQITRLTDTTFVVVKDQGDAQVVTLFTTESGLVQKKHAGRFLY